MAFNFRRTLVLFIILIVVLQSCRDNETTKPLPVPLPACDKAVLSGYTDKTSYFPGEEVQVYLQSASPFNCALGFFNIKGSLVFSLDVNLFHQDIQPDEPYKNGFKFLSNGKIKLPQGITSGIYLIENKIPFIVKSSLAADITVVYPVNTINAYCNTGGKSLYGFNSDNNEASTQVSFLRPIESTTEYGECVECLRWFPSLVGYSINYITDVDLNDYTTFKDSKLLMIIGHSEYWTRLARVHFDQFVNSGKNAIVLSGNTMWWHARYTASKDALICHRDPVKDPEPDPAMKTVTWTDPSLQFSILTSIGEDFEHGGYGLHDDYGWDGYKIVNPLSPLLTGLGLNRGDIIGLPTGEYDGAPIKGFDLDGYPLLDNDLLKFEKVELIGFDRGSRAGKETIPTFIILKRTKTSGIIVNAGSNTWCSGMGIGSSVNGDKIKTITKNAIVKLLSGQTVFSN
ncbi:MAG: hypothetical protein JSS79_04305 [Bacteroidetes bacterium]|nr:hypothetical protein [Bacteroidota bacterium]